MSGSEESLSHRIRVLLSHGHLGEAHAALEARGRFLPGPIRIELSLELAQWEYDSGLSDEWGRARARLDEVIATEEATRPQSARAHHLLGVLAFRSSETKVAFTHLERALTLLEDSGPLEVLARVHDSLGQLYEYFGDHRAAVAAYVSSMGLKSSVGDGIGVGISLHNTGRLLCRYENWAAAIQVLTTRVRLATAQSDDLGFVASGGLLALAECRGGDVSSAHGRIATVASRARSLGHPILLGAVLKSSAQIALFRDRIAEAQSHADEALALFRGKGNTLGILYLQHIFGDLASRRGDPMRAWEILSSACEQLRKCEDHSEELAALEAWSRVCMEREHKSQALENLDRALFLARRYGYEIARERLVSLREEAVRLPGRLRLSLSWERRDTAGSDPPSTLTSRSLELEVLQELGRGAYGIVYRVEDRATGRQYALKELHLDDRRVDERVIARLRSEALAASRLRHPSIIEIYQIVEDGRRSPKLIMEFLEGGSLRGRQYPWRFAFRLVAQLADALSQLHAIGIIHRDIKPSNLLLRRDGTPVITDFGTAHLPGYDHTLTGELLGTLDYIPPECFGNPSDTGLRDVFALGVTLYELVEGRRPYPSGERPLGRYEFPAVDPRKPCVDGLLEGAGAAMLRMVARDPSARFGAASARDALNEAARE